MTRLPEIYANNYYANHGMKDFWYGSTNKSLLDETRSYVNVGKDKKIRFLAIGRPGIQGQGRIRYYWNGWVTRLERLQAMVLKAKKASERFYNEVLAPEARKYVGQTCHYWTPSGEDPNLGYISCITVEESNRYRDYEDETSSNQKILSWSTGGSTPYTKMDNRNVPFAALVQFPNWAAGEKLRKLIDTAHEKSTRYQVALSYLHTFIGMKLGVIEKNYKTGDVIEFNIGPISYRFERLSRFSRDHQGYGLWKQLSANEIKKVDILSIMDKEFYL